MYNSKKITFFFFLKKRLIYNETSQFHKMRKKTTYIINYQKKTILFVKQIKVSVQRENC